MSILLPAWNAATTLPGCLRSVARQTFTDWECIVVDDGSTDDTLALARDAARRDPRIRVVAIAHGGIVGALQAGLAACRGRWVARMDADDVMHRDRLRLQRDALCADPTLAGVGCHVRIVPRRGLRDGFRGYEAWLASVDSPARVRDDAFVESPLVHPTLTIDRGVLSAIGYRAVDWPEDYDLVLRLLAAGHRLGVVPRRLLCWRDAPHRLTRTDPHYGLDRITACKAAFLAEGFLASSARYTLWGYGDTGRALRQALARHDKHPALIVELHPGRLGNTIHGAPVIPPDELPQHPRWPLLASVAGAEARGLIRSALATMGYVEGADFVCAA